MSGKKPVILVTGFEPFRGYNINPSIEAVKLLPDELLGCTIVKRELPVVWFECTRRLDACMAEAAPRAVLSFGQGHAQPPVVIERLGMNICSGSDNTHVVDIREEPVFYGAPAAYFATVPYAAMHKRLKDEGIPVKYGFDAGRYQCNCVLYSALHLAAVKFPGTLAGFIHLPMLPEQVPTGMPLETSALAARFLVEEVCKVLTRPARTPEEYMEDL